MSPQRFRREMAVAKLDRLTSTVTLTLPMSCQICLGKVKQPVICPNCHVFCRACSAIWSQRNDYCATCRAPVTKDNPYRSLLGGEAVSEEEKDGSFCNAEVRRARAMRLIDSYEDEIERLNGTVSELTAKNKELLAAASEAVAITEVGQKLSEATRLYDKIEADLRKLQRDNEAVRKVNDVLTRENDRLKAELASASTTACSPGKPSRFTLAALESQVEQLRRDVAALESALELSESREAKLQEAVARAASATAATLAPCNCTGRPSASTDARLQQPPVADAGAAASADPAIACAAAVGGVPDRAQPASGSLACDRPSSVHLHLRSAVKKKLFDDGSGGGGCPGSLGTDLAPKQLQSPPRAGITDSHLSGISYPLRCPITSPVPPRRRGQLNGVAICGTVAQPNEGDASGASPAKKRSSTSDVTTFYGGSYGEASATARACAPAKQQPAVDGDSELSFELPSPLLPSTPLGRISLGADSHCCSGYSSCSGGDSQVQLPASSTSTRQQQQPAGARRAAPAIGLSSGGLSLSPPGSALTSPAHHRSAAGTAAASAELERWNVSATEEMIDCILLLNAAESKVRSSSSGSGLADSSADQL